MATVLIVEDNKNTQMLTAARLKKHYNILTADDGAEALDIVYARHVDLIVADVMMPNMDGFELLTRLRSECYTMPVLLLTAKQSIEDKQIGFDSGTDDYMTKPVDYQELLMRVRALLRRANISAERKITVGAIVVDAESYTVTHHGNPIILTKKEFDLLFKFLSYPDMIFTRDQLIDEIWGPDSDSMDDTVKTHISRLRGKLTGVNEFTISTIKGLGYKLEINQEMVK